MAAPDGPTLPPPSHPPAAHPSSSAQKDLSFSAQKVAQKKLAACLPCRLRKRKCDAKHPICTPCRTVQSRRSGERCVYPELKVAKVRKNSAEAESFPSDPLHQMRLCRLYNLMQEKKFFIVENKPNAKPMTFDDFINWNEGKGGEDQDHSNQGGDDSLEDEHSMSPEDTPENSMRWDRRESSAVRETPSIEKSSESLEIPNISSSTTLGTICFVPHEDQDSTKRLELEIIKQHQPSFLNTQPSLINAIPLSAPSMGNPSSLNFPADFPIFDTDSFFRLPIIQHNLFSNGIPNIILAASPPSGMDPSSMVTSATMASLPMSNNMGNGITDTISSNSGMDPLNALNGNMGFPPSMDFSFMTNSINIPITSSGLGPILSSSTSNGKGRANAPMLESPPNPPSDPGVEHPYASPQPPFENFGQRRVCRKDIPEGLKFHLVTACLLNLHTVLPMFHIPTLLVAVAEDTLEEALLLALCGVGTLYKPVHPDLSSPVFISPSHAGEMFIRRAEEICHAARGVKESLQVVQALILVSMHDFGMMVPWSAYHFSEATKMAQRLDMDEPMDPLLRYKKRYTYQNHLLPFSSLPTETEKISRRRTWKTLLFLDTCSMFGTNTSPYVDESTQLHLLSELDDLKPFSEDRSDSSIESGCPLQSALNRCWPKWLSAINAINSSFQVPFIHGFPWKSPPYDTCCPLAVLLDAAFLSCGYAHMVRLMFIARRLLRSGPSGSDDPAVPAAAEAIAHAASSSSSVSVHSMTNILALFSGGKIGPDLRPVVTPLQALYQWYSELPEVYRHFMITERGFIFRGIPESTPLNRSIFIVTLNIFTLAVACISSNVTPTNNLVLRTNAQTLGAYLMQLVAMSRSLHLRPELLAAPLGFFIHVASLGADALDRVRGICPTLKLTTKTWRINTFFSEMCFVVVTMAFGPKGPPLSFFPTPSTVGSNS